MEEDIIHLKDIRIVDIGRHVTIKGIVKDVGTQYPFLEEACFECENCGLKETVLHNIAYPLNYPVLCSSLTCRKNSLILVENESKFVDMQEFTLYESTDLMDSYRDIRVFLTDNNVGQVIQNLKYSVEGIIIKIKENDTYKFGLKALKLTGYASNGKVFDPLNIKLRPVTKPSLNEIGDYIKDLAEQSPDRIITLRAAFGHVNMYLNVDKPLFQDYIDHAKQAGEIMFPRPTTIKYIE